LVIAHRLATIQHADRIVVVGPDGIVEEGAHLELLHRAGAYRRLHEAQFGPVLDASRGNPDTVITPN
jgi:ATP-binding cassette subfamily B protein